MPIFWDMALNVKKSWKTLKYYLILTLNGHSNRFNRLERKMWQGFLAELLLSSIKKNEVDTSKTKISYWNAFICKQIKHNIHQVIKGFKQTPTLSFIRISLTSIFLYYWNNICSYWNYFRRNRWPLRLNWSGFFLQEQYND